jgi:thiol:disulfide interchange protein DsbD
MERVKQLLAFPLYATAAWLLWVLAQQIDQASLLYALVSVVLMAFGLWLWQTTRTASGRWQTVSLITLLGLGILFSGVLWKLEPATTTNHPASQNWQPYDETRLAQIRAEGKPVLVNFTAAWCITCLVNEKVALATDEVQAKLKQQDVVYMKGDWTNKDPAITRKLQAYGRSGVPLYLLYPKELQREAIVLPNILTPGIVVDALQQLD